MNCSNFFNKTIIATILIIVGCLSFGLSTPLNALENQKDLTLAPLRFEFDITPGTADGGYLTITNPSAEPALISCYAEEFSVVNQQYDYAFTAESNVIDWVSFESSEVSLLAGESKRMRFDINVPLSAEPGGRYISLFVSRDDKAGLSKQRIASLVYINVVGKVTRLGSMLSLSSPWLINGDSNWSVVIQNSGTTHFRSRYSATLYNLFNREKISSTTGEALILPNSTRLIIDKIPAIVNPGVYKLAYVIGLGDTPAVTRDLYILYLPTWLRLSIILAVVAYSIFHYLKRKN